MKVEKKRFIFELTSFIIISISLFILSIYNVDNGSWIWNSNNSIWQKMINIFVSLSGFVGILALYFFAKKKNIAYLYGILNAILYSLFAFTNGLVIDALLQIIYILILVSVLIKQKIKKNARIQFLRSSAYSTIIFFFYFVIFCIAFYFLNPYTNDILGKILNINYFPFGSNFKYKLSSSILLSIFNALSIVALTMMSLGFKESWLLWGLKNILCFIFFSGIAFLNVTLILINLIFLLMGIYLFYLESKHKTLRIAILGNDQDLKANLINKLKPYLDSNEIFIANKEIKYTLDEYKKLLIEDLDIIKMTNEHHKSIIIHHLIDDIYNIDKKMKNNSEKNKWNWFYKIKYKFILSIQPKLDLVFILENDKNENPNSFIKNKYSINSKHFAKKYLFVSNFNIDEAINKMS